MVQRHSANDCIRPPLSEELPTRCRQLLKALSECKYGSFYIVFPLQRVSIMAANSSLSCSDKHSGVEWSTCGNDFAVTRPSRCPRISKAGRQRRHGSCMQDNRLSRWPRRPMGMRLRWTRKRQEGFNFVLAAYPTPTTRSFQGRPGIAPELSVQVQKFICHELYNTILYDISITGWLNVPIFMDPLSLAWNLWCSLTSLSACLIVLSHSIQYIPNVK